MCFTCYHVIFSIGATPLFGVEFGSGPIYLNQVECLGTEEFLIDCFNIGVSNQECTHFQDVGVRCLTDIPTGK